jgi:hypothetical protein
MAKTDFVIAPISKSQAAEILTKYHYLTHISRGFKSGYNYGCFLDGICIGVAIFTGFPVPELAKGMFGLDRNQQEGLFELSRVCLVPNIQQTEHNLASWFLSRAIKELRKTTKVRAILSYADTEFHTGTIYAATNFKYYGTTTPKKDFFIKQNDGSYLKHSRGKVKGLEGEWRNRSTKHRFVLIFDKRLNMKWQEQKWGEKSS